MRFPRLEALLGVASDSVDLQALRRAVDLSVPEGADLDWKESLYARGDKGNAELAKDVAALGNASGGLLVLGVAEEDGRAARLTPVQLSEGEQRRMREVIAARVRPFLAGVDIREVAGDQLGTGFYVLAIPRSPDAPHAVVDGTRLGYPVRNEETTRWLNESEVAVAYRSRFVSQGEVAQRVEDIRGDGSARLRRRARTWLTLALASTSPAGPRLGVEARSRSQGFLFSWARSSIPTSIPRLLNGQALAAVPGRRRLILTSNPSYSGVSEEVHLELHSDGSGFAALVMGEGALPQIGFPPPQAIGLSQGRIEMETLSLVSLLVQHAFDAGAGGEFVITSQLLPPENFGLGLEAAPLEIHAPRWLGHHNLGDEKISGSLTRRRTSHAIGSVLAGDADLRGCSVAAYALLADVLGEFGVGGPMLLAPDGSVRVEYVRDFLGGSQAGQGLEEWAVTNGLSGIS